MFDLYYGAKLALETGMYFYDFRIDISKHKNFRDKIRLQRLACNQIFSIRNNGIQCLLPATLVKELLQPHSSNFISYMQAHHVDLFAETLTKSALGNTGQTFLIDALTSGNQNIQLYDKELQSTVVIRRILSGFKTFLDINPQQQKKKIDGTSQNQQYGINNALDLETPTNSNSIQSTNKNPEKILPVDDSKQPNENLQPEIFFIQSFKEGIQSQIIQLIESKQAEASQVYCPQNKNLTFGHSNVQKAVHQLLEKNKASTKQKQLLTHSLTILKQGKYNFDKIVPHTHKTIDFVIVSVKQYQIFFRVFYLNVAKYQTNEKAINFLTQFIKFSDQNKSEFNFQGKSYKISLSYNLIGQKNAPFDPLELNKKFARYFTFSKMNKNQKQSESRLDVKSVSNPGKCILKQIGSYDIYTQLQFFYIRSNKKNDKVKIWQQFKEQLQKNTSERQLILSTMKNLIKVLQKYEAQGIISLHLSNTPKQQ